MKSILLILVISLLFGASVQVKDFLSKKHKIDDPKTQLKFLYLFKNSASPNGDVPPGFNPGKDLILDSTLLTQFLETDWLKKGEIFSIFNERHLEQAILLFKVYYYAKTVDDVYKIAVWSRSNINEGLWSYALSVALVHRPDSFGIILPPKYETHPHLFFNSEIMNAVEVALRGCNHTDILIDDDPLNRYSNLDQEQLLTYFTEDVGLNLFYYMYHIFLPWWMDGKEFGLMRDQRGEMFYHVMLQLVARYNAERLSNGLDEVSAIDFTSPLDFGYYPSLRYPNGVEFPSRPEGVRLNEVRRSALSRNNNFTNSYTRVRDFAFRIQNVIDLGAAYWGVELYKEGFNGLEVLSNLLEGNPNSLQLPYYGTMQIHARHLLGYAPEPLNKNKAIPAATEHYETTLRDPASWRFFKWLLNFYDDYYKHLKPYTKEQLGNPNAKIESIDVEEIITFFEYFTTDLSQYYNTKTNIHIRQKRLNHSPLTYNITVSSGVEQDVLIKSFIAPKYDRYGQVLDITENTDKFYGVDYFSANLKEGKNVISRTSDENVWLYDRTSFKNLVEGVTSAIDNKKEFIVDGGEAHWPFPGRLFIPKGTRDGMKFQLYVFLMRIPKTDQVTAEKGFYKRAGSGGYSDLPLRFPLDRKITKSFFVKHSHITDIIIRHDENIRHK